MDSAQKVLDYWLRDVFHFKGILFVWSGRRGFHVHVYDVRVLEWTSDQRTAFVTRILNPMPREETTEYIYTEILRPLFLSENALHMRDRGACMTAVFNAIYPKIDVAVTKDASHLKGIPLTIHHDTRYIRIPLPSIHGQHRFLPERDCFRPSSMSIDMLRCFMKPIKMALDEALM